MILDKNLIDMSLFMQDAWSKYRSQYLPDDGGILDEPAIKESFRQTFFAGAIHAMLHMLHGKMKPDEIITLVIRDLDPPIGKVT